MLVHKNVNMWSDYLSPDTLYAITTNGYVKNNGECVMGRGTALQAANMHPGLPKILGDLILAHGNVPYMLPYNLVSVPVKHDWRQEADLDLIIASLHWLGELLHFYSPKRLYLPLPGAGNGGLDPQEVLAQIEEHQFFDYCDTEVNVFYYDEG